MGRGYKLIRYWIRKCEAVGLKYDSNINADTVGCNRIVDHLGYDDAQKAVDWYFEHFDAKPDPYWFIYNYDKVVDNYTSTQNDRQKRDELKRLTREAMKEQE